MPSPLPILSNPRCNQESCPRSFLSKNGDPKWVDELSLTTDRVIYAENQSAESVYCIRQGAVKIYKTSHNRQVLIDVVLAGTMLGGIHNESIYRETAEGLAGAVLCKVSKTHFLKWQKESSECLKVIFDQTESTLLEARVRQVLMSKLSAIERLAYYLARFTAEAARLCPGQKNSMVPFKLSRADYADLVGTSVESVVRMLKELCDRGILRVRAKEIEVKDPAALNQLAGIRNG